MKQPNKRSPRLPDELQPIVDAVVEVVFERLKGAASRTNKPVSKRSTRLNLPLPKQRTALAEALADLLLADLARPARVRKKAKKRNGRGTRSSAQRAPR